MKIWDVKQGSDEWHLLRAGIPTASNFGKIITPAGRPSKQAEKYIYKCIAEIAAGEPEAPGSTNEWMERGLELEQEAADWYAMQTGSDVRTVGFVTDDQQRWGASPDRLIYDGDVIVGGVEIKCPAPWTFVKNAIGNELPSKYIPQVQGQIYIGELPWVDWVVYHPLFGGLAVRVLPDDEFCATLENCLLGFDEKKEVLLADFRKTYTVSELDTEIGGQK